MFQFPRFASVHGRIPQHECQGGFPHSDTRGSTLLCSSPQIFAAWHVLHRHCMPRHPPCALFFLYPVWLAQPLLQGHASITAYLMSSIFYLDLFQQLHARCLHRPRTHTAFTTTTSKNSHLRHRLRWASLPPTGRTIINFQISTSKQLELEI